jgi:hypothetical protein
MLRKQDEKTLECDSQHGSDHNAIKHLPLACGAETYICEDFSTTAQIPPVKAIRFAPVKKEESDIGEHPGYCYLWTLETPGSITCIDIETVGTGFVCVYQQPVGSPHSLPTHTPHQNGLDMIEADWWGKDEKEWRGEWDQIGDLAGWGAWCAGTFINLSNS